MYPYVQLSTPKWDLVGKGISWKMRCCGISWSKTGIKLASAAIEMVKEKSAQAMEKTNFPGTAGIRMRKEHEQISSYLISVSFDLLF